MELASIRIVFLSHDVFSENPAVEYQVYNNANSK
jgi:hypothetical protein